MREENQVTTTARAAAQPERGAGSRAGLRGCWELLIKIIILLILILILLAYWFALGPFGRGDFNVRGEYNLWVWLTLILLILLLIYLIWRQKHFVMLNCDLTQPTGCRSGKKIGGKWLIAIEGTAAGIGFGHYELGLYYGGSPIADGIIYADAGGNPDPSLTQGNNQVNAGTLGFVDVQEALNGAGTGIFDSADFEVRLRVVGVDQSTCNHSITFQLRIVRTYIKKVGAGWAHAYTNPNEELCRIPPPAASSPGPHAVDPASVGGTIYVRGAASVRGCSNEQIAEVHIWAVPDDTHSFAKPANGTPIATASPSNNTYHSEVIFTNNDQRSSNPLDLPSDEGAILTYDPGWFTREECFTIIVDPSDPTSWFEFCLPPVPDLHESGWPTGSPSQPTGMPTGKYTLLLGVSDTAGHTFYDIQRVWVDNAGCVAQITTIGGLTGCLDLRLSQFQNTTCEIRGFAWDRAIRAADPQAAPNDNFGGYSLTYQKNGLGTTPGITPASAGRVPVDWAETTPVADGVLANWNIVADIDNGNVVPDPTSHKLQRGTRCAFNISLSVTDTTLVGEGGSGHWNGHNFAVNIINDL